MDMTDLGLRSLVLAVVVRCRFHLLRLSTDHLHRWAHAQGTIWRIEGQFLRPAHAINGCLSVPPITLGAGQQALGTEAVVSRRVTSSGILLVGAIRIAL